MKIIAFEAAQRGTQWRESELREIVEALTPALEAGKASSWEIAATEAGDPQFYLLGPAPEEACEICISRLGRRYILEDGEGRLLLDTDNLTLIAERAAAAFRRGRLQFVARVMLGWCLVRQFLHDRLEPLIAEGEEMLAYVAVVA